MGGVLMWYRWTDLEGFNAWHAAACQELGIPHPGRNAATGEVDEDAQWTTAYTEATVVADDDVRAVVEDDVAALVPEGLGVPCDPPPSTELIADSVPDA
jgi:hypothetical protein